MSTRKRLESLTADLSPSALAPRPDPGELRPDSAPPHLPEPAAAVESVVETRFPTPGAPSAPPRTGPGQMLAFRGQLLAMEGEVDRLRAQLARHDGAIPTRRLNPEQVSLSRWSNRHEASYGTPEFARLKADIEHAGGNVQPVLVRPLEGEGERYELVFGHRRLRACKELKLPVLAAIWTEPLGDQMLFAFMERENRERANLSPFEQGTMYQRALDEGLYPSHRRLAEALGVSHTWVRKALAVAQLPPAVIDCFPSPIQITHRHAEALTPIIERDRRGVLKRAERLRGMRLSANAVVAQLLDASPKAGSEPRRELRVGEAVVGTVTTDGKGATTIALRPGVLAGERMDDLLRALAPFLQAPATKPTSATD